MDILQECEMKFGQPRTDWGAEQWRAAALSIAEVFSELECVADGLAQASQDSRENADKLIELLELENERLKTTEAKLVRWVEALADEVISLRSKRAGRPRKPPPKYQNALYALLHYKPKRTRGRPAKMTAQEQIEFVKYIDHLKEKHGFTKDRLPLL